MSSRSKKINWGILGPGKIARKFTQDLIRVENARVYAIGSRDVSKAEKFKNEFNAVRAFGNYDELFEDPEIDAIYVAVPHSFHFENTIKALENGKAVLCEKPLAINSNEVARMIQTAKSENTLLMEALWTRFLPHFSFIHDFIQQKQFGKVLQLEADFGFTTTFDNQSRLYNKSLGGGSLLDIGIYPVFAALSLIGVPEKIEAAATFAETEVDSSCEMNFYYNTGTKAILKSTLLEDTPGKLKITCERGEIGVEEQFYRPANVYLKPVDGKRETKNFTTEFNGFKFEIDHFNNLLLHNEKESDIMSYEFSTNLMKTLDRVKKRIGLKY